MQFNMASGVWKWRLQDFDILASNSSVLNVPFETSERRISSYSVLDRKWIIETECIYRNIRISTDVSTRTPYQNLSVSIYSVSCLYPRAIYTERRWLCPFLSRPTVRHVVTTALLEAHFLSTKQSISLRDSFDCPPDSYTPWRSRMSSIEDLELCCKTRANYSVQKLCHLLYCTKSTKALYKLNIIQCNTICLGHYDNSVI